MELFTVTSFGEISESNKHIEPSNPFCKLKKYFKVNNTLKRQKDTL